MIRRFGLIGQAFGTLIPVAFFSIVVLWPAACRRVGIDSLRGVSRRRVAHRVARGSDGAGRDPAARCPAGELVQRGSDGAVGTAAYAITFLAFAVNRDERQVYLAKATELLRSRWREPAAA